MISVNKKYVDYSTIAKIWWGLYERAEINFVDQFISGKVDVVELGASVGVVTGHLAKKLGRGRLICVEANELLLDQIERNIVLNNGRARYQIIHGAISDVRETVQFRVDGKNTDSKLDKSGDHLVKGIFLSDLLKDLEIRRYELVADIEGAEKFILASDAQALQMCELMIIELHAIGSRSISICDMSSRIIELGFRMIMRRGSVFVFQRM
ncbi:MAG: FkbM family methyltransferase [Saprospiraceae bacterium]|nr:FkbM family methyltransferase [Saprospiraceae bacterium]